MSTVDDRAVRRSTTSEPRRCARSAVRDGPATSCRHYTIADDPVPGEPDLRDDPVRLQRHRRRAADRRGSRAARCDWWRNIFAIPELPEAFRTSLEVRRSPAADRDGPGHAVGLALGRYRFRGAAVMNFVIFLAIAVPEIVLGSSLLTMFVLNAAHRSGRLIGSHDPALAHRFSIAFVAITVRARVQGLDRSLEDAAPGSVRDPDRGVLQGDAAPHRCPASWPGSCSAFVLSLDDFVITNFVAGQTKTFPHVGVRRHADRRPAPGQRHGARCCSRSASSLAVRQLLARGAGARRRREHRGATSRAVRRAASRLRESFHKVTRKQPLTCGNAALARL